MERNEERPDVRFWTTYDHFMVEREARALRRKHMLDLTCRYWKRASARLAQSLKRAGAQPVKTIARPA